MAKAKQKNRNPEYQITEQTKKIYLNLVSCGLTFKKISECTGYNERTWLQLAKSDKTFGQARATAKANAPAMLNGLVAESMINKIREGNPWWVRFAIKNGMCSFNDPDAEIESSKRPLQIIIRVNEESAKKIKSVESKLLMSDRRPINGNGRRNHNGQDADAGDISSSGSGADT